MCSKFQVASWQLFTAPGQLCRHTKHKQNKLAHSSKALFQKWKLKLLNIQFSTCSAGFAICKPRFLLESSKCSMRLATSSNLFPWSSKRSKHLTSSMSCFGGSPLSRWILHNQPETNVFFGNIILRVKTSQWRSTKMEKKTHLLKQPNERIFFRFFQLTSWRDSFPTCETSCRLPMLPG